MKIIEIFFKDGSSYILTAASHRIIDEKKYSVAYFYDEADRCIARFNMDDVRGIVYKEIE